MYDTSIFAIAHTDLIGHPFSNEKRTIRVVFRANVDFTEIKLRLSNRYGVGPIKIKGTIGFCTDQGEIPLDGEIIDITVNGETDISIRPEEDTITDTIKLECDSGCFLAISLYYPEDIKTVSGNLVGDFALRSIEGDYTHSNNIPTLMAIKRLSHMILPSDNATPVTSIKEVCVKAKEKTNVLAVIGDSLTQQGTWIAPLAQKLYSEYPSKMSVLNLGISGNRLCHDSSIIREGRNGEAGVKRFHEDVLKLHGLTHLIIALGTNDIGLPGKIGIPEEELITLEDYKYAQTLMVSRIREKFPDIKIYAATLLPRRIQRQFTKERERLRLQINEWIRDTHLFDYVLDFDNFAYEDKEKLDLKDWYIIDGLHLSEEGGKELSEMIPTEIFV